MAEAAGPNSIQEAVQAGLQALWAWADRSGTGQLSARERADLLRKLRLNQLTWLDDDRNGCMSFNNFVGMVNAMSPEDCSHVFVVASLLGSLRNGSAVHGTALQHLFDFFSDDGITIPAADFQKFARRLSEGLGNAVPAEVDITFDAFAELLAPKAGDAAADRSGTLENVLITGLQLLFTWMDHDRDLRLDERERGEFMLKMGLKTLSWMDHTDDGRMSFKEFREMLDALPPEECTDIFLVASMLGSLRATKPVRPNSTEEVLRLFDFFRLGTETTVNAAAFIRFAHSMNLHIAPRVPDGTEWNLEQFAQVVYHGEPATPLTPTKPSSGHSSKTTTPRKTVAGSLLEAESPWEVVDNKLVKQEYYRKPCTSPPQSPRSPRRATVSMSRSTQHQQSGDQPSVEHLLRVVQHLTPQQWWDLHLFLLGREAEMSTAYPASWATAYLAPLLNICVCDQYQVWITLMRGLLERVTAVGAANHHNGTLKADDGPEAAVLRDMLLERDQEIERLKADAVKWGSHPETTHLKLDLLNRDARIADLEARVAKLSSDDDVGRLKQEVLKRDDEISRLEAALHEAVYQVSELNERLARREVRISDLERAMATMVPGGEAEGLRQELQDCEAELAAAQVQLHAAVSAEEFDGLRCELLKREDVIADLRDQVAKLTPEDDPQRLKEEVLRRDGEIRRLQAALQQSPSQSQVAELEDRVRRREAQALDLERVLAVMVPVEEVDALRRELDVAQMELAAAKDQVAKLTPEDDPQRLKEEVLRRDGEIRRLQAALQQSPSQSQVAELEDRVRRREAQALDLERVLAVMVPVEEVDALRRELDVAQMELAAAKAKASKASSHSSDDRQKFEMLKEKDDAQAAVREAIHLEQIIELEERLARREAQISEFEGMISAPALQDEVERLRRALKDVEAELAAAQEALAAQPPEETEQLRQRLEEYSVHIQILETQLQAAPPAEEVESLHKELLEREDVIEELRARVASLSSNDDVGRLQQEVVKRDSEISRLLAQLQLQAAPVAHKPEEVLEREAVISELQTKVHRLEKERAELAAKVGDQETKIAELSELAETSIQMALAAERMTAELQQRGAQGPTAADVERLVAEVAERDAKLAELTELAEHSIQMAMSVDPLRAELRASEHRCNEEREARAVTEGQLELLRAELQRRDARIMEVEDELDRSHRSLEGPRRVPTPDLAGAPLSPEAEHVIALEAEQRATHESLQRADERIRALERLADHMLHTAFPGELEASFHTTDLSTREVQDHADRMAALEERLQSRRPQGPEWSAEAGDVVLQDFEGRFVFRNLTNVRAAMETAQRGSSMVGLRTFLRLLHAWDPSVPEPSTADGGPSGTERRRSATGTPRGRETDSPADEYDPTESVALRDYSVLFIFNKLGLLRTCLHRLATSGDTAEYVGLNTFLDCLRGPGPSSPLHFSPRDPVSGTQWPDGPDQAGSSNGLVVHSPSTRTTVDYGQHLGSGTPGSASPEALRRFGSAGSSLSSTQVAPDAPQRQTETMQRLQHLEAALKEKVARIADLEVELSEVKATLMAAEERLMEQDKLIHTLRDAAQPLPKPAIHVKFQEAVEVCPTAYRTVSTTSSASVERGDTFDSVASSTVSSEAADGRFGLGRQPFSSALLATTDLEDTLVYPRPPSTTDPRPAVNPDPFQGAVAGQRPGEGAWVPAEREQPPASAAPQTFGGDGEVARLRAEAVEAGRRLRSLQTLLEEQEHRMRTERITAQHQLERVRLEASHGVPQDVHDEVVKEVWRERLRAEALQERLLQLTDEAARKASEDASNSTANMDRFREVERVLRQEVVVCRQECQRLGELSHSKTLELQAKDDLLARLKEELRMTREENDRLQKLKREKDALAKSLNVELLVQASRLKYAEEKLQLLQTRVVELEFRQPVMPPTPGPPPGSHFPTPLDQSGLSYGGHSTLNRSTSPSLVVAHVCVLPLCNLCQRLGSRPVSPAPSVGLGRRSSLGFTAAVPYPESTPAGKTSIPGVAITPETPTATLFAEGPPNPPPPLLQTVTAPAGPAEADGLVEEVLCDSDHHSEDS